MAAAVVFSGCEPKTNLKLVINNDSELDRTNETVELDIDVLNVADMSLTADNVIILDKKGHQVPTQVYTEFNGAKTLVFQASVAAGKKVEYYLGTGEREEFPMKAYSRYVPEREDDYTYENDLVAGRIYGPALAFPKTFGSDIWVKCPDSLGTDVLVIDKWYRQALEGTHSYHSNHDGQGMDCYKVAQTLGGGALVPLNPDGTINYGDNWATQQNITNGPVRTKAYLTYGPFAVGDRQISAVRELSLDAGSRFVKSVTKFTWEAENREQQEALPVVLGAIKHKVKEMQSGENWIAFTEAASDTKDAERDGDISIAIVMSPKQPVLEIGEVDKHAAIKAIAENGKNITVWTASGWSRGGIENAEAWDKLVSDFAYAQANPLKAVVMSR